MKKHTDENLAASKPDAPRQSSERLSRYLRKTACSTAAGLTAMGAATQADAALVLVDPPDFGVQPSNAFGWVSETPLVYGGQSFGIDILRNGGALDVGLFRGSGYYGYLVGRTDRVGYVSGYGNIYGSGQVRLLSNDTELPDTGSTPGGGKKALQGFLPGQLIGDGNDADALDPGENVLRDAYSGGDWEAGNGVPSYIGFKIDIDDNGSFDGFGWIEVIVDDPGTFPNVTVTRWAYTTDGSPIAAGVPEPGSLALLAAGLGAAALRRKK